MKTADLTGALLDYWTARAEGVPAGQLEIRATGTLCVRNTPGTNWDGVVTTPLDYSTNWALSGPLVEKHKVVVEEVLTSNGSGWWHARKYPHQDKGETPLIAICRAVVRAAFGDAVEDLPCQ